MYSETVNCSFEQCQRMIALSQKYDGKAFRFLDNTSCQKALMSNLFTSVKFQFIYYIINYNLINVNRIYRLSTSRGLSRNAKIERALLNSERELAYELNLTVLFRNFERCSLSKSPAGKGFLPSQSYKSFDRPFSKGRGVEGQSPPRRSQAAKRPSPTLAFRQRAKLLLTRVFYGNTQRQRR